MNNIINETEIIATAYLNNFGFKEEQVSALITQGKKDLHNGLEKLEILLANNASLEEINNALHALKGLFSQLGNHKVAEHLDNIRNGQESEVRLKEISELLFNG